MANKLIKASFLLVTSFILALPVNAKLLPRFSSGKIVTKAVSSGVGVSVKLRADRKALNLYLSNLNKARSIGYMLIYQSNGVDQGVNGSIETAGIYSTSRDLLFGTCSSGVCKYHTNITNMRLEVTSELTSGKKTLRRFKIRV